MKTCNQCGTVCEDEMKFCSNCGAPLAMQEEAVPEEGKVKSDTAEFQEEFFKTMQASEKAPVEEIQESIPMDLPEEVSEEAVPAAEASVAEAEMEEELQAAEEPLQAVTEVIEEIPTAEIPSPEEIAEAEAAAEEAVQEEIIVEELAEEEPVQAAAGAAIPAAAVMDQPEAETPEKPKKEKKEKPVKEEDEDPEELQTWEYTGRRSVSVLAVLSIIFAIVGVFAGGYACLLFFLNFKVALIFFLPSVLGILFGLLALQNTGRGMKYIGKTLAIFGIIFGILAIVLWLVGIFYLRSATAAEFGTLDLMSVLRFITSRI